MTEEDLKLLSTDDLLAELGSRFDHWVFSGGQIGIQGKNNMRTVRRYGGHYLECIGLARLVERVVIDDFESTGQKPIGEGDDVPE